MADSNIIQYKSFHLADNKAGFLRCSTIIALEAEIEKVTEGMPLRKGYLPLGLLKNPPKLENPYTLQVGSLVLGKVGVYEDEEAQTLKLLYDFTPTVNFDIAEQNVCFVVCVEDFSTCKYSQYKFNMNNIHDDMFIIPSQTVDIQTRQGALDLQITVDDSGGVSKANLPELSYVSTLPVYSEDVVTLSEDVVAFSEEL